MSLHVEVTSGAEIAQRVREAEAIALLRTRLAERERALCLPALTPYRPAVGEVCEWCDEAGATWLVDGHGPYHARCAVERGR